MEPLNNKVMKIDIVTILPEVFEPYLASSILGRAREKGLIDLQVHDLRRWTLDAHRTVDDSPFGGGAGMVLMIEPIYRALQELTGGRAEKRSRLAGGPKVFITSSRGKKFNQKTAWALSREKHLIFIAGRYEAVDERVLKYLTDGTFSIGPYVLTGGELPVLVAIDAITRLLPGVLGDENSLKPEFRQGDAAVSFPQYTRPEIFIMESGKKLVVPKTLLSGHHAQIKAWRAKKLKKI